MDGKDSEEPKQSTADMTDFVQNLLQQMQTRFQTMSESIVSKNILSLHFLFCWIAIVCGKSRHLFSISNIYVVACAPQSASFSMYFKHAILHSIHPYYLSLALHNAGQ
ncbi:unnamed protein product [Ilex paraguariensis]|uniref:Heat shock factor binding protein n=1 Tax=Ilex paraguariensis TaxID=185542 RepID=A0ABC8U8E0_9AQUA